MNRKRVLWLLFVLVLLVSILIGIRIYYVNTNAVITPTKVYAQDKWVALAGDFQEQRLENTEGYSIKVEKAEFITYSSLVTAHGETEEYLEEAWRPNELVLLTMNVKNEGNEEGYLFLFDFFLQAENYVLKPELDLWRLIQPEGGGNMSVKLKPDSSYTLIVPYAPTPADEDYGNFITEKREYYLVVSRYPVKKVICVRVS